MDESAKASHSAVPLAGETGASGETGCLEEKGPSAETESLGETEHQNETAPSVGAENSEGLQTEGIITSRKPAANEKRKHDEGETVPAKRKRLYKLTKLAKKFGKLNNSYAAVEPWSSGLTPRSMDSHLSWYNLFDNSLANEFQRTQFFGWTTRELQAIDALPHFRETVQKSNLANEIHPIFSQDNWKKREELPLNLAFWRIGHGREGYWEAQNPVVWKELETCLQLASRIITGSSIGGWWDALVYGDRRPVDPPAPAEFRPQYSFHRREAEIAFKEREILQRHFVSLAGRIKFTLGHSNAHRVSVTRPEQNYNSNGLTYTCWQYSRRTGLDHNACPTISINFFLLERLVLNNLTDAEMLTQRFFVAATIVHELAHAVSVLHNVDMKIGRKYSDELFFEDEVVAECGWSMENAAWGYLQEKMSNKIVIALFMRAHPTDETSLMSTNEYNRGHTLTSDCFAPRWPVSMIFFENIWSKEFWENFVVRYGDLQQFGSNVVNGQELRFGPFLEGSILLSDDGKNFNRYNVEKSLNKLSELPVNSPADLAGAHFIESRRIEAWVAAKEALATVKRENSLGHTTLLITELNDMNLGGELSEMEQPKSFEKEQPESTPLEAESEGNDSDYEYEPSEIERPDTFEEIHRIMCENHDTLALPTTESGILEHVLLEYVNRIQGERVIGWEEFNQYLKYMSDKEQKCFKYIELRPQLGQCRYLANGWPEGDRVRPPPIPPTNRLPQALFDSLLFDMWCSNPQVWANGMNLIYSASEPPQFHDIEQVRCLYNKVAQEMDRMDYNSFVNIVNQSHHWMPGPPGVIRWKRWSSEDGYYIT